MNAKPLKLGVAAALAFLAISGPTVAQQPGAGAAAAPGAQPDTARLLAAIQSDKKSLVARNMKLTEAEAARFWPLYDAFQKELEPLQRSRTRAALDFVAAGPDVSPDNARRLANLLLEASQATARLRKRQFDRLAKAIPADKAARYVQIENKIEALILFESAKAIPLAQ